MLRNDYRWRSLSFWGNMMIDISFRSYMFDGSGTTRKNRGAFFLDCLPMSRFWETYPSYLDISLNYCVLGFTFLQYFDHLLRTIRPMRI